MAEDPPFVHWQLYNIPPDVLMLEEGLPGAPKLKKPEGALQAATDRGSFGYVGPQPPVGDPAHRYHVQVFALDTLLDLPFGASRAELLAAMRGRVLAQGELVSTFQREIGTVPAPRGAEAADFINPGRPAVSEGATIHRVGRPADRTWRGGPFRRRRPPLNGSGSRSPTRPSCPRPTRGSAPTASTTTCV